jgi:hypothetical protein
MCDKVQTRLGNLGMMKAEPVPPWHVIPTKAAGAVPAEKRAASRDAGSYEGTSRRTKAPREDPASSSAPGSYFEEPAAPEWFLWGDTRTIQTGNQTHYCIWNATEVERIDFQPSFVREEWLNTLCERKPAKRREEESQFRNNQIHYVLGDPQDMTAEGRKEKVRFENKFRPENTFIKVPKGLETYKKITLARSITDQKWVMVEYRKHSNDWTHLLADEWDEEHGCY